MTFALLILGAAILLLLAGIIPVLGPEVFILPDTQFTPFPTHLYNSPVFLSIVAIGILYCLFLFIKNKSYRKNYWLWLTHFAFIAVCISGYLFQMTREVSAPFRLNYKISDYRVSQIVMMPERLDLQRTEPDKRYQLPEALTCTDFTRETYPPDYEYIHLRMPEGDMLNRRISQSDYAKVIATLPITEKGICYQDSVLISNTGLYNPDSSLRKWIDLGNNYALALRERDKYYRAMIRYGEEAEPRVLEVNAPLDLGGGRKLFLQDYDNANIIVNIVIAPYERPLRISLILFFFALTGLCLTRFYKESAA